MAHHAASGKKPVITRTETIARTRLFRVEQVGLRFANGCEVNYERLRSSPSGAVLVVPMLDDSTVLLIREYAAGVERYELALPKGIIEEGESPFAAANREIMEEVGYGARQLTHLKSVTLAPGYFSHATHVVLAQELYPERREGDEPEAIEVVPWSLDRLTELCAHEECTEARSIAALFLVRELLAGRR
ncbi:MAG: ADP compounds hydrolase NudE [Candidatus Muproteobacteria bacterium RIFCSPHIGHO2_12_FULL_60_33]|uniref:ADP compounds hydrolase NudE n=1 Tax=Candidatus Muproteobacteria bacterium RIFCSPLOWO2_01_FULL_60_18 TaxID=1817768 RepID=A0A1F6U3Y9_9PROT|nr:MAG: ADP compounds hydrolase NudE [Candidatus Muproteobacteria bacterium RIFCSPHIGHO2_01_60_12]OGI52068.1 MAG: ADP compounds hydrolase NudE [Candidatus Muproteobacteria bacterium RIFCSPLOWO2_01_FULL_60_18]OGI55049.1 MAG: ADP compounds hydrolase NudE [Candidatus Muproteobacteria bacterium RIFCSPHIGHO2_12_FULL_60_33]OGI56624.1 MAG: ADP compounds hydrolase NudE [Candidatus Muproteobacteria bacterium RIFCSPHIGHO2_02_FULL_60_13]OGI58770.1 MAG: ADP compounds hydrolase NudE [Candidatus Muproteobact